MKIYDISMPLNNDMLVWKGDPNVQIKPVATIEKDGVALSQFTLGSHTGTHVDAPSHFVDGGTGIDAIDLEKLIGPCKVVDVSGIDHLEILPSDFSLTNVEKGDRILFKTGNYKYLKSSTFPDTYISLSMETAELLVKKGVVLVGIDFLGVEKEKNPGHPVHTILLKAGIVNVEGLDLSEIEAGEYEIICLPLRVAVDGSPARAILIKS